jgi:hypothetical protein
VVDIENESGRVSGTLVINLIKQLDNKTESMKYVRCVYDGFNGEIPIN